MKIGDVRRETLST